MRANYYFILLAALLFFSGCSKRIHLFNGKKDLSISGIVRDFHTDSIINNVKIVYSDLDTIVEVDTLGFFYLEIPKGNQDPENLSTKFLEIIPADQTIYSSKKIKVSKFLDFYHILLKRKKDIDLPKNMAKTADMHYHIGLKPHNEYGQVLYNTKNYQVNENLIPGNNLTWQRRFGNLCVMDPETGKWVNCIEVSSIPKRQIEGAYTSEDYRILKTQFEGVFLRPKKTNNTLYDYSQGSLPIAKKGNVKLIFNSITPLEHNLASNPQLRFISKFFKTKAQYKWLRMVGGDNRSFLKRNFGQKNIGPTLTHWQNFQNAYGLISSQDKSFNELNWRFLNSGKELEEDSNATFIVNVIEGSHSLQGKLFPHKNYGGPNTRIDLKNNKKKHKSTLPYWYRKDNIQFAKFEKRVKNSVVENYGDSLKRKERIMLEGVARAKIISDTVKLELEQNIKFLKDLVPKIYMITIGHLSYNGMMDHAPALDASSFLGYSAIRKTFRIKVSNDENLLRNWKQLFFTIPEVNSLGQTLIEGLLKKSPDEHRVFIDLKHSGFAARLHYLGYLDSLHTAVDKISLKKMAPESNGFTDEKIPPICSHCGANGLSATYYSPLVDEYGLTKAKFVKEKGLYPFSINLYDEEIEKICELDGIIGVTVEERVLGGYILDSQFKKAKKRREKIKNDLYDFKVKASGEYNSALKYLNEKYHLQLGDKILLDHMIDDYISVEPFLNTLFYMMRKSGKEGQEAWKHFCIGSDIDGLIDPIDILPTAAKYPYLQDRLKQFIPIYLEIQKLDMSKYALINKSDYDQLINDVFYNNLEQFVINNFN